MHGRRRRGLRAQPNVEIELVNRLRACRRDILDVCVAPAVTWVASLPGNGDLSAAIVSALNMPETKNSA